MRCSSHEPAQQAFYFSRKIFLVWKCNLMFPVITILKERKLASLDDFPTHHILSANAASTQLFPTLIPTTIEKLLSNKWRHMPKA